jgi:hypothetical protein
VNDDVGRVPKPTPGDPDSARPETAEASHDAPALLCVSPYRSAAERHQACRGQATQGGVPVGPRDGRGSLAAGSQKPLTACEPAKAHVGWRQQACGPKSRRGLRRLIAQTCITHMHNNVERIFISLCYQGLCDYSLSNYHMCSRLSRGT